MTTPCPNPHCGVRTFNRETATLGNITYRRRYCPSCDKTFLTRETYHRLERTDKNPFSIAHALRDRRRKEPSE